MCSPSLNGPARKGVGSRKSPSGTSTVGGATVRRRRKSPAQPECEEEDGSEATPPVDDRPHLRVVSLPGNVVLRHGDLAHAVAQREHSVVQVVLELVAVEPLLIEKDARV